MRPFTYAVTVLVSSAASSCSSVRCESGEATMRASSVGRAAPPPAPAAPAAPALAAEEEGRGVEEGGPGALLPPLPEAAPPTPVLCCSPAPSALLALLATRALGTPKPLGGSFRRNSDEPVELPARPPRSALMVPPAEEEEERFSEGRAASRDRMLVNCDGGSCATSCPFAAADRAGRAQCCAE